MSHWAVLYFNEFYYQNTNGNRDMDKIFGKKRMSYTRCIIVLELFSHKK